MEAYSERFGKKLWCLRQLRDQQGPVKVPCNFKPTGSCEQDTETCRWCLGRAQPLCSGSLTSLMHRLLAGHWCKCPFSAWRGHHGLSLPEPGLCLFPTFTPQPFTPQLPALGPRCDQGCPRAAWNQPCVPTLHTVIKFLQPSPTACPGPLPAGAGVEALAGFWGLIPHWGHHSTRAVPADL